MMRAGFGWTAIFAWSAMAVCAALPARAQTHAVKRPDDVVRAVAVYEWTGEEGKATASRVVPVSLFIHGEFQDAAIFMARPVPLAIDTGTVYEVRKSGVDAGTLELVYERHLTGGDAAEGSSAEIDDGWLGYGEFKVKPKESLVAKNSGRPLSKLMVNGRVSDAGAPRQGAGASAGPVAQVDANDDDSSSPVLHRRAGSGGDSTEPAAAESKSAESGNGAGATTSATATRAGSAGSDSDDDAERPTLKRRTPAEIRAKQKDSDSARVVAGNDLNDDPDRPTLHRGSKTQTQEEAVPPLRGLPKDMKQLVAVSDAKDRPEHDFVRQWESEDERAEVLGKMQAFARERLAGYKAGPTAAAPAPASVGAAKATSNAAARSTKKKTAVAATSAATPLNEESLKGYTLSYGGASTYVYSATSPDANGISRYVAVVAQEEPVVGLKVALASVTDSSHLDRTPWMRFVDVVDADASNRASLLMELRAQHTRQFALYRVIGAQADQVFLSGSTE